MSYRSPYKRTSRCNYRSIGFIKLRTKRVWRKFGSHNNNYDKPEKQAVTKKRQFSPAYSWLMPFPLDTGFSEQSFKYLAPLVFTLGQALTVHLVLGIWPLAPPLALRSGLVCRLSPPHNRVHNKLGLHAKPTNSYNIWLNYLSTCRNFTCDKFQNKWL